jgi:AcrR family transcriptional regulator
MGVDRRVQRTRTALYEALVKLIREKDYDAISVEDILGVANVGRSTFYTHFGSKDDLLARSFDRLKAQLAEVAAARAAEVSDPHEVAKALSRALFEHVAEFRDIQLALAGGRGAPIVSRALSRALTALVRDLPLPAPPGLPRELAIEFTVATFATVLRWWFERHPEMTPGDANALFLRLIYQGFGTATAGNFRESNHVP